MLRIRPLDVVAHIDSVISGAAEKQAQKARVLLDKPRAGLLLGIVNLVKQIDPALLPTSHDYVRLLAAVSAIEAQLAIWNGGGSGEVEKTPGVGDENPVIVIRRIMEGLPNEVIPEEARRLIFMNDPVYREDLERDLASVEVQMQQEQWKAAMALAGSVAEALLLDAIKKHDNKNIEVARQALEQKKDPVKFGDPDPDNWHFHQYVLVAERLDTIGSQTRSLALAAADGRNLLHPGRASRQKEKPTRAKALAVVAALESVIEDLQARAIGD